MTGHDFWERIDNATKQGYSRKELAADAGVSVSAIAMWKNRKSYPAADIVVKIAKALGTTVEYLVTGDSPEGDLLYSRIQADPKLKELAEIGAMLPENRIDDLIVLGKTWLTADTQSKERHA